MSSSTTVATKILADDAGHLAELISTAKSGSGEAVYIPTLVAADLDRTAYDRIIMQKIQTELSSCSFPRKTLKQFAKIQLIDRDQRDIYIASQGHKRHMLSCLLGAGCKLTKLRARQGALV